MSASLCNNQCQYTHSFQCAKMHTVYLYTIYYKASNPLPWADDWDRRLVNFGIWLPYLFVLSLDRFPNLADATNVRKCSGPFTSWPVWGYWKDSGSLSAGQTKNEMNNNEGKSPQLIGKFGGKRYTLEIMFRYILRDWVQELPGSFSPIKLGLIKLLLNTEWFHTAKGE